VVALLSLFYGKRVINHGQIWSPPPFWSLPDLQKVRPNPYHALPIYSGVHTKAPVKDNDWTAVKSIKELIEAPAAPVTSRLRILNAARAYAESLGIFPLDREIAYFRLIQALEAMVYASDFPKEERFSHDRELNEHIRWLDGLDDPHGPKTAAFISKRLYQVKRGVWLWLSSRIDATFYSNETGALTPEGLQNALSNAYDLRSTYVHAGQHFGDWIDPIEGRCGLEETVPPDFAALCEDQNLRKLIQRCPSYLGLERLVRFALHRELQTYP
jgi:hypothetical protein